MKKIKMDEALIRLADLGDLRGVPGAAATVVVTEGIYADVVFRDALKYFRLAHRDGNSARVFSSIKTAAITLAKAGFGEITLKIVDADDLEICPEWLHVDVDAPLDDVELWEQKLDQMGLNASIEELRSHLVDAPPGAESAGALKAFIAGYDRAIKDK